MKEIEVPVTYRIEVETIFGKYYKGKVYYSIGRVVQALSMMKIPDIGILWLVCLRNKEILKRERIT